MKISELSTDRAADVLCEITPYIANMAGDKVLMDTLKEKIDSGGYSIAELYVFGAKKLSAIVPILLKNHRNDVFSILAVLNEVSVEDVAAQNIMVTMGQIKEIAQDKELLDFFKSWRHGEEAE